MLLSLVSCSFSRSSDAALTLLSRRWSEGFTPGGALAIPPSKTNGYSGINLCFRRRVVEAKVETDIEEGMFVQPEIRAQIERVDRWRRPISPDRGKQLDNSV